MNYKAGDKVYVKWPTGKDGPWEICSVGAGYVDIWHRQGTECILVPVLKAWCEPVKPALEPDRLYYWWDDEDPEEDRRNEARIGDVIDKDRWDHIEPIYRRWDELSGEEQDTLNSDIDDGIPTRIVFSTAYKLITGEEHP